jgi:hypothetical protein
VLPARFWLCALLCALPLLTWLPLWLSDAAACLKRDRRGPL